MESASPGQRHKWDKKRERRLAASEFEDGCSRTFRVCQKCGLQKVTVIPPQGFARRAWIMPDGIAWDAQTTPPCFGSGGELRKDDAA